MLRVTCARDGIQLRNRFDERVRTSYPHLCDDAFAADNLGSLAGVNVTLECPPRSSALFTLLCSVGVTGAECSEPPAALGARKASTPGTLRHTNVKNALEHNAATTTARVGKRQGQKQHDQRRRLRHAGREART